jgi:hypothetical protein
MNKAFKNRLFSGIISANKPVARRRTASQLRVEPLESRILLTTFNVADFGSIQAAVDAAAASPGDDSVQIPVGIYSENVSINDASGALGLVGLGGTASDVVIDGGGNTTIVANLQNNVSFRGLRITNGFDGILAFGAGDVSLRNVELTGNVFDGLDVDGGGDITVEDSVVSGNGPSLSANGLELSNVGNVRVARASLNGNGGDGIFVFGALATDVLNVTADNNGDEGVSVNASGNVTIRNSEMRDNLGDSINLFNVGDVLIQNDQGTGGRFDGLEIVTAGNVSVSNAAFSSHVLDRGVEIFDAGNIDLQNVDASNNAGIGISLVTVGDVGLTNVTASNNGSDGVFISGAGNVEVDHLEALDNVFEGLDIDFARDVSTSQVTAARNGDNGLELFGIQSWIDQQGSYLNNGNHGALAGDIAGDVALTGTRAEDNDSNGNSTGAGVRFFDGGDVDPLAIGGSLTVTNGAFNNNRTGLYSSHTIAGNVSITNVGANDNQTHGLRFSDLRNPRNTSIGGNLTITNAQLNRNEGQGLLVQHAVVGDVTLTNVTANENGFGNPLLTPGNGVLILGAGNVSIVGGQFNGNEDDGIRIQNALSVTLLGVVAENNGDNDLEVLFSGTPTIKGGRIGNILILP